MVLAMVRLMADSSAAPKADLSADLLAVSSAAKRADLTVDSLARYHLRASVFYLLVPHWNDCFVAGRSLR